MGRSHELLAQKAHRSSSRRRRATSSNYQSDSRSPDREQSRANGESVRIHRRRRSHRDEGKSGSRRFSERNNAGDEKKDERSSSESPWLNRIRMQSSSSSEEPDRKFHKPRRSRSRKQAMHVPAGKGSFDQVPVPLPKMQDNKAKGAFDSQPERQQQRLQGMMNRMTQQQFGKMTLKMTQLQIRCLLGKNGITVQSIMRATGAQIHVKSPPQSPVGEVSLAGNIGPAMEMIKEILETRGCPYSDGEYRSSPSVIEVPEMLIGELIGPKAGLLLEIQARLGEDVVMQKHPYVAVSGARPVQIAGLRWKEAREIVAAWVDRKMAFRR